MVNGGRPPPPTSTIASLLLLLLGLLLHGASHLLPCRIPYRHRKLLALLLLRRLLLGHEITSFRGSFSSPSLRAAGARPAPVRGARNARGRRTAAVGTPP